MQKSGFVPNAMTQNFVTRFSEEPYRIFFPLGILFGSVGAGHWAAYSFGWVESYSGFFHASIQTQGYISCFITGFLLTAMPRFSSTSPCSTVELFGFLLVTFGILVFLSLGLPLVSELCFMGWLVSLALFAYRRVGSRKGKKDPSLQPPVEFVWIPMAILHGLIGSVLILGSQTELFPAWALAVGRPMVEQGFLLAVVVGVGGFLAPRLMGRFQVIPSSHLASPEKGVRERQRRAGIHLLAGALLFVSFWLEGLGWKAAAYGLRACVVTGELLWTCSFLAPPRVPGFFAKLLWLSLWMILLGYWGVVIFPAYRVSLLHFVFLGGFSLMTFAVATVVTLSHSGEAPRLQGRLPVLWGVAAGLAVALVLRVLSSFSPELYFTLVGTAALSWLVAGGTWIFFAFPRFFKFPDPEEFKRFHEEAKRQVSC